MTRKNIEDLVGAFLRQKFRHRGIQDYDFAFKWAFEVELEVKIKRIRYNYKGTIAQEEVQIALSGKKGN